VVDKQNASEKNCHARSKKKNQTFPRQVDGGGNTPEKKGVPQGVEKLPDQAKRKRVVEKGSHRKKKKPRNRFVGERREKAFPSRNNTTRRRGIEERNEQRGIYDVPKKNGRGERGRCEAQGKKGKGYIRNGDNRRTLRRGGVEGMGDQIAKSVGGKRGFLRGGGTEGEQKCGDETFWEKKKKKSGPT